MKMERKYPYLGISVEDNPDKTIIVYFSGSMYDGESASGTVLFDNNYFKKGTTSNEWDERFLLIEAGILPEGFDKPTAELFASKNWYKSVDPEIMDHVNLLLEAVHEFCPSCNYSFSEFCWELKK